MKKRAAQRGKRGISFLLAVLFVLGGLQLQGALPDAKAVTQAEIDNLKDNANALDAQKEELQDQLDALESDKSKAMQQIDILDQQSDLLRQQISNTESLISHYEQLVAQTRAELEAAEQKEEEQYALFCKRVRAMEEQGNVSYWAVLFKATDFADLLGRLDAASEIMAADQRLIDELEALQQQISSQKAALEASLAENQAAKAELDKDKAELEKQLAKAQELAASIESGIGEYEDALAAIEAEEARVQAEIARKEKELAASLPQPTAGGYIWPVTTSKRITCKFGPRTHPITGKYSNHTGVDIGGVGYTSDIRATKDGIVLEATHSTAYGYYIVISHGSGNTTLYAHMSKGTFRVSEGDRVTQGQVIGTTGSSGYSTGPHLHYEIRENGSPVDPLKYLPGYVQAW